MKQVRKAQNGGMANQVKETLTGIFCGMGLYTIAVELVGVFFSESRLTYTLGLLIGTVVAVILIFHMTKTLDQALDMPEVQATKYVRRNSFFRLFLMLVAMIFGLAWDRINFISLVLGLLGVKIGAMLAPLFLKKMYPEHYTTQEEQY